MAQLAENADETNVAIPLFIVFIVGIVIGSLIVAWSLWRREVVPVWAAAAIVVSAILGFLSESVALSAIGFAFLLVGLGAVGMKLLSMSDEEWDRLGEAPAPAQPSPGPDP